jgi:catechol 2,3-dioxygenase-like lactoylglutathione lyase family enzyme
MGNGVHIAFNAPSREAVDAFFLAALDKGGVEDGRPGLRTEYHPDYYAAFVRDPDGNKIEACAHAHE